MKVIIYITFIFLFLTGCERNFPSGKFKTNKNFYNNNEIVSALPNMKSCILDNKLKLLQAETVKGSNFEYFLEINDLNKTYIHLKKKKLIMAGYKMSGVSNNGNYIADTETKSTSNLIHYC